MQDVVSNKDDFFRWFVTQNIYGNCELNDGCYDTLFELNKQDRIFIATDYIVPEIFDRCGYILDQKFKFLQENLPFINPKQYIFLANKGVLNMDVRIDGRIINLSGSKEKLLFSAYHNLDYSYEYLNNMGIERMNDWFDVKRRLLRK